MTWPLRTAQQTSPWQSWSDRSMKWMFGRPRAPALSAYNAAALRAADLAISHDPLGYQEWRTDLARHAGISNVENGLSRTTATRRPAAEKASNVRLMPSLHSSGEIPDWLGDFPRAK